MDIREEHHLRDLLRAQRKRLEDASGGDSYYSSINMTYGRDKLEWTVSIGSTYGDQISMKGEVLEELVTLLIETYTRRNNIKLRALEAPISPISPISPIASVSSPGDADDNMPF
jgi:hypothetical protein